MMDGTIIPMNSTDIAATIVEEGFMIGKNNSANISLDADALEIYTNMKTKGLFDRFKMRPLHAGTLYFRQNGGFSGSWYFDNNYFGEPIDSLRKKLENKYRVKIVLNDKYEVVWGKDDPGA